MNRTTAFKRPTLMLMTLLAAAAAIAAAPAVPALANPAASTASQATLPPEMNSGNIRYLTGGTGAAESKAFKEAMHKYPLAIELAEKQKGSKHEAFTANALIRISDHGGKEIFSAQAKGPFMLVELEPGTYSMTATLNNHTLRKQSFRIQKGKSTREVFVFPAGTD